MNKVKIYCNVTDVYFSVGYTSRYIHPEVRVAFNHYMAMEISKIIVRAIDDQRYAGSWVPLNPYYKATKIRKGLSPKIWEATGFLKLNVQFSTLNDTIRVGIDPYIAYKSGVSTLKVAQWLEFGTKKMPERPLFRPIIAYVRKNIKFFYYKFLREYNIQDGQKLSEDQIEKLQGTEWSDTKLQKFMEEHSLSMKGRR